MGISRWLVFRGLPKRSGPLYGGNVGREACMRIYPSAKELDKSTKRGRYAVGHGAYLQISEWGTRAWLFRYVRNRRPRHIGMGSTAYTTLAEARERAVEYRRMLARGVDPFEAKRGAELQ